jgi:hypothetical protein
MFRSLIRIKRDLLLCPNDNKPLYLPRRKISLDVLAWTFATISICGSVAPFTLWGVPLVPIFRIPRKRAAKAFENGKGKLSYYEMHTRRMYDRAFLAKLEKENLSVSPTLLRTDKLTNSQSLLERTVKKNPRFFVE